MDLTAFDRVALPALRTPRTGGVVVVVVATVHQARHQFTDAVRRRPGIRLVRVTEATRDALPEQLMDRLIGAPRGEEQ